MHYDTTPTACLFAGHEWLGLCDEFGNPMCSRCGKVDDFVTGDDRCDYCGADRMDGCDCHSTITGIEPGCSKD